MRRLAPQVIAQQFVAPIINTETCEILGVAYSGGGDRIITRWKPDQADELRAVGLLMLELAEKLREARERGGSA